MCKIFFKAVCVLVVLINLGFIQKSHAGIAWKINGEAYTTELAFWNEGYDQGTQAGNIFGMILNTATGDETTISISVIGPFDVKTYSFTSPASTYEGATYGDYKSGLVCMSVSGTLSITSKIADRLKGIFEFSMVGHTGTGAFVTLDITDGSFDLSNGGPQPTTTSISSTSTSIHISTTTTIYAPNPCMLSLIYGESSAEIDLLRYYRDNVLSHTLEGRELIKLYYLWSPTIIIAMEQDKEFKRGVKEMIDSIIPMIEMELD